MESIRVTAHFLEKEQVKKAVSRLKKKCPNDYDEMHSIGKKVSFTTTLCQISPLKITRVLLEESSANVLHHLNDCKGLVFCTVVNQ